MRSMVEGARGPEEAAARAPLRLALLATSPAERGRIKGTVEEACGRHRRQSSALVRYGAE
jgi:hypothetical protein